DRAVEPGEVAEHAGVGQAEEAEVSGEVELDAVDLAVADVRRLEHESALAFRPLLAGVDQLDQVLDLAVEQVDPDYPGAAEMVLVAEISAPGLFGQQQRVAAEVVVADLLVERRRSEE